MFAPAYEKAFHKAVQTYAAGDAERALVLFRESAAKDTGDRAVADDLFVGLLSAQLQDDAPAIEHLEKVIDSEISLPDELMSKYVPGGGMLMGVTEHVTVEVPFGSLAALLTLVEVYQRAGCLDEAIGLLQQFVEIAPEPFLVLSLCDLYAEAQAFDEIVDLAAGTANEDDVSLQIRLFHARALVKQGMNDAALAAFKDALRSSKRDADLLREARYERAKLYLDLGKKAQGQQDLERIYADDPNYRDVRELLGAPAAANASPPAWHPDPEGKHELRYWDGARWTEQVSDRGVQSIDPTAHDAASR